ncbi:hypothetical protein FDP41_013788 [Naegleria fowleri]|uniref:Uncharacterized protein n=1 Tax=Naegleria fowleri TaxID=5763 RepID=A0A6A5C4A7_NAEFO|nr:uncharacterized protein FDP41_013788 [Naegleria fowleri]KAF0980139.1 hypothetical protein FDP41_013788 [Naegleria fowleri]
MKPPSQQQLLGICLLLLFVMLWILLEGNELAYPHVHASSVQAIPFVSLIHEENRDHSSLIEEETLSFPLSHENNLMNQLNRLQTLMNRREMIHSFSAVNRLKQVDYNEQVQIVKQLNEPRSQFIVKLKEFTNEFNEDEPFMAKLNATDRDMEWLQSMVMKSGKPLRFSNVFAVVAKTSEIISSFKAIEWIDEYEPRFKSALNFQKIQQLAQRQLGETFHTSSSSVNKNDSTNKNLIHVIITILPSLDAILVNQELEEAHLIANELNSKLTEWFSQQRQQQWKTTPKRILQ